MSYRDNTATLFEVEDLSNIAFFLSYAPFYSILN